MGKYLEDTYRAMSAKSWDLVWSKTDLSGATSETFI
jgi:hypothetical protein